MSKIALVTGGSKGIGSAIVDSLIQEKRKVWQISRTKVSRRDLVSLQMDLEKLDFTKLITKLRNEKPTIETLILNAGHAFSKPIEKTSLSDLKQIFQINVFANYELIKISKPYFSSKTKILLFSSLAGMEKISKFPGFTAYAMTKACMISLSETLSAEWPQVQVHCISPGSVETQMFRKVAPKGFQPKFTPSDVAKLCLQIVNDSPTSGVNWVMM